MLTNMNRYIEVEKLKAEIERRNLSNRYITTEGYEQELYEIIASLQQEQLEGGCSEKPNDLLSEQEPTCKDYTHFADVGKMEQPEVDLEKAARNVYKSLNDVHRDMVELGRVINARKEEDK